MEEEHILSWHIDTSQLRFRIMFTKEDAYSEGALEVLKGKTYGIILWYIASARILGRI